MAVTVITRLRIMARWEPGARERLQAAALELFATRGFEQTTAAEIAQSVGLTERTFFRHFSDKREVLFYGQEQFLQAFSTGCRPRRPAQPRWRSSRPRCAQPDRSSQTNAAHTPACGRP